MTAPFVHGKRTLQVTLTGAAESNVDAPWRKHAEDFRRPRGIHEREQTITLFQILCLTGDVCYNCTLDSQETS